MLAPDEPSAPLLTAADAAALLGRSARTAQVVASRRQGGPGLRRIGGRWVAPLQWWREQLADVPARVARGAGHPVHRTATSAMRSTRTEAARLE